jgi:hypothetical protein
MSRDRPAARWLGADGRPIACVEKLRVLDEILAELGQLAQDTFDDALLMGCDEQALRMRLHRLVDALSASFAR